MELQFRKQGDAAAPVKVFRHIGGDLSDVAVKKDDRGRWISVRIPEEDPDLAFMGNAKLPKVPREPSHGQRGAPPVSKTFLREIAAAYEFAVDFALHSTGAREEAATLVGHRLLR
mgnify:CR=1 FL=1